METPTEAEHARRNSLLEEDDMQKSLRIYGLTES